MVASSGANSKWQAGFTLIEALIALAILAVLAALTFVNLGKPQTTASLSGTVATLLADVKGQQQLAMAGDDAGTNTQQAHGLVFAGDSYTLFAGTTFDSGDSNNFTVTPGDTVSFGTTLPDATLQFAKTSGEVENFDGNNNTVTVHVGDASQVVTINRFGTVTTE